MWLNVIFNLSMLCVRWVWVGVYASSYHNTVNISTHPTTHTQPNSLKIELTHVLFMFVFALNVCTIMVGNYNMNGVFCIAAVPKLNKGSLPTSGRPTDRRTNVLPRVYSKFHHHRINCSSPLRTGTRVTVPPPVQCSLSSPPCVYWPRNSFVMVESKWLRLGVYIPIFRRSTMGEGGYRGSATSIRAQKIIFRTSYFGSTIRTPGLLKIQYLWDTVFDIRPACCSYLFLSSS